MSDRHVRPPACGMVIWLTLRLQDREHVFNDLFEAARRKETDALECIFEVPSAIIRDNGSHLKRTALPTLSSGPIRSRLNQLFFQRDGNLQRDLDGFRNDLPFRP